MTSCLFSFIFLTYHLAELSTAQDAITQEGVRMSTTCQQLIAVLDVFQEVLARVRIQIEATGGEDAPELIVWVTKLFETLDGFQEVVTEHLLS